MQEHWFEIAFWKQKEMPGNESLKLDRRKEIQELVTFLISQDKHN
jgi:hypothetical protein